MNCYLDWASTTPVISEALENYFQTTRKFHGNPSSLHIEGRKASGLLADLRKDAAEILGVHETKLIFTSGGTESNSLIHTSLLRKKHRGEIIISGIDHPSVYEYEKIYREFGFTVHILKAPGGFMDLHEFEKLLTDKTQLVSVMMVNNVTGTIQPIKEMIHITREFEKKTKRKIHFHTDAVQALGKIKFSLIDYDMDSASFSSHKIQGPKGIGMLFAKKFPQMLNAGGGQEFSFRHGTESLASISSFVTALRIIYRKYDANYKHAGMLQNIIIENVREHPELYTFPIDLDKYSTSPYITIVICHGIPSEVTARVMNDKGYSISAGSACSSKNRKKRERVLRNMGYDEHDASTAIRISTGPSTSMKQVINFCNTLNYEVNLLHKVLGKR